MFKLHIVFSLLLFIISNISHGFPAEDKDILDLTVYGEKLFGPRNYAIDKVLFDAYEPYGLPDNVNPEELGSYLEGDLLVPTDVDGSAKRAGKQSISSLWPGGLVPYEFEGDFDRNELRSILEGFDEFSARTCIQFYPRSIEKDYISIQNSASGCFSAVGRMGGKQVVNFNRPYCFRLGTVVHELMHSLGYSHEQKRYDRDQYVKIKFENIKDGHKKNFKKLTKKAIRLYGIPYDYGSILHYSRKAFSRNGKETIIPLRELPAGVKIGQRKGFSRYDLDRINARYQCSHKKKTIEN